MTGAVRKDDEYCALCSSAAAAVAIGQLQLQLSHYSLVVLQAFFPRCDFWGGLEGASKKNFLGSLSLATFSGPLINYAIIRPLHRPSLIASKGLLLYFIMISYVTGQSWINPLATLVGYSAFNRLICSRTSCKPIPQIPRFNMESTTLIVRYSCCRIPRHSWAHRVPILPARRYASAGYRDRNVSVCPSVRHAPVLCQNEEC